METEALSNQMSSMSRLAGKIPFSAIFDRDIDRMLSVALDAGDSPVDARKALADETRRLMGRTPWPNDSLMYNAAETVSREYRDALARALATLSESEIDLIWSLYNDGETTEQLAEDLGTTPDQVSKQHRQILAQLRDTIVRGGELARNNQSVAELDPPRRRPTSLGLTDCFPHTSLSDRGIAMRSQGEVRLQAKRDGGL